jgi:hypothetical protein
MAAYWKNQLYILRLSSYEKELICVHRKTVQTYSQYSAGPVDRKLRLTCVPNPLNQRLQQRLELQRDFIQLLLRVRPRHNPRPRKQPGLIPPQQRRSNPHGKLAITFGIDPADRPSSKRINVI